MVCVEFSIHITFSIMSGFTLPTEGTCPFPGLLSLRHLELLMGGDDKTDGDFSGASNLCMDNDEDGEMEKCEQSLIRGY